MSEDTLEDWCIEFLHLKYILEELHHYSKYDLEKVRLKYYQMIKNIATESSLIANSKYVEQQMESDKLIVGEEE